ncbi:aminotransferase class V-fold PLP-dependent enzyme [Streptomyces sp. NPDC050560]|uniref:aminotransferase class V-fold PLP-dependent enzyme n=1 Tax=Streptomyces sp. NPDC050560 TaxID=3365630 RepID=UPI0037B55015
MAQIPGKTPPHPPLYTPFKWASARLTPRLRDSRLSSNAVTVTWGAFFVAASFALASEHRAAAALLVLLAVLLDCLDGDLARIRNQPSLSGTLLEQFAHWIGNMSLIAGAGAALLLADPRPRNVLLVSSLTVVQAVYVAVVRQIRPNAANISGHRALRRAFRAIVRALWLASPIELPIVAVLIVFGPASGTLLALLATLVCAGLAIFVPHFLLIRAADRGRWEKASEAPPGPDRAGAGARDAPEADWWVPGTPRLPGEMLALLGAQPVPAGSPFVRKARQDLDRLLPGLFRTTGRVLPLACPPEAAFESVVSALSTPTDRVVVAGGRSTVRRWRPVVEHLGREVTAVERAFGGQLDRSGLALAVAAEGPPPVVILSMADPEDGALTDLPAVLAAVREPASMVILDATLGLCADELRMDEWGVDVALASSAGGVMAPPGTCLLALGARALAVLDSGRPGTTGGYPDLHAAIADQRPAHLPTPALLSLRLGASLIQETGLDTVLAHRGELAERFRRQCAERAGLTPVAGLRTSACTTFALPQDVPPARLRENLWASARMVVGHGHTPDGTATVHVGHLGRLTTDDVDRAATALADAVVSAREDVPSTTGTGRSRTTRMG